METIVPEARGRAEALRTYLAGGGPRIGKRYTQGKLKGKTIEQAQVEFDRRWAGASGKIKDKYANMAGKGAMSPSEQADYETRVAGLNPTPKPTPVKNEAKAARVEMQGPPAPVKPREAQTRPIVEPARQMIGDQASQQRAEAELARTSGLQTAENGGKVSNAATVAADPGNRIVAGIKSGVAGAWQAVADPEQAPGPIVKNGVVQGMKRTGDPAQDLPTDERMRMQGKANTAKPVAPAFGAIPGGAPNENVSDDRMAKIAQPAQAGVSGTPGVAGVAGITPSPNREIAIDGSRNLGDAEAGALEQQTGQRINTITGLPFGYTAGQALPAGADQGMKDRAAASVARQTAASAGAAKTAQPKPLIPGITKPTPTPGGPSLEEGWARDQRIADRKMVADKVFNGGSNAGLKAGPIRPLSELVKPTAPPAAPVRRKATPEEIAKYGVGSKPAPKVAGINPTKFARRI